MKEFVEAFGHWLTVFFAICYTAGFWIRWRQNHSISKGHYWTGYIAVIGTVICTIVLAFAPEFQKLFWPLCLGGSAIWVLYNDWYFWKYPIPTDCLAVTKERLEKGAIVPKSRLSKFLVQLQPENKVLFGKRAGIIGVVALILFLFALGFRREVYRIAEGQQSVVAERKKATTTINTAVASVKNEVTTTVKEAVDTLKRGQQMIAESTVINNKKVAAIAASVATESRKTTVNLSRKIDRVGANVERTRRSNITIPTRLTPKSSNFTLPPVPPVQQQQPNRRGRKQAGLYELDEDREIFGRNYPQPE